jgi:FkbM family methyltransferase
MNERIRQHIRPLLLRWLRRWQLFYDDSRARLREFEYRFRVMGKLPVVAENVHGIRFIANPVDQANLSFSVHRPSDAAEFEAMSHLVRPGNIALDVGANIGIYCVFLSWLCGPAGKVWAFEPVPETYWRLRETLTLNRCENVVAVEAALSDKRGSARMNLFEPGFADLNTLGSPSAAMRSWKKISPVRSVEVPTRTLDEFCESEGIERINFLKVDVEGFELNVFRGAQRLLREQRIDYICFEIFQPALEDADVKSRDVFGALEAHGYSVYRFDREAEAFQGPIADTLQELNNFFASCCDLTHLQPQVVQDCADRAK